MPPSLPGPSDESLRERHPDESHARYPEEARVADAGGRRWFLVVNGTAFVLTALLAVTADGVLAAAPLGGPPLGVMLSAVQLALLLATARGYERTARPQSGPSDVGTETGHGQRHQADGARAGLGRPYRSHGRRR